MQTFIYLAVISVIKDLALFEAHNPEPMAKAERLVAADKLRPKLLKCIEILESNGSGDDDPLFASRRTPSLIPVTETVITSVPAMTPVIVTTVKPAAPPSSSPMDIVSSAPSPSELTTTPPVAFDDALMRSSPDFLGPSSTMTLKWNDELVSPSTIAGAQSDFMAATPSLTPDLQSNTLPSLPSPSPTARIAPTASAAPKDVVLDVTHKPQLNESQLAGSSSESPTTTDDTPRPPAPAPTIEPLTTESTSDANKTTTPLTTTTTVSSTTTTSTSSTSSAATTTRRMRLTTIAANETDSVADYFIQSVINQGADGRSDKLDGLTRRLAASLRRIYAMAFDRWASRADESAGEAIKTDGRGGNANESETLLAVTIYGVNYDNRSGDLLLNYTLSRNGSAVKASKASRILAVLHDEELQRLLAADLWPSNASATSLPTGGGSSTRAPGKGEDKENRLISPYLGVSGNYEWLALSLIIIGIIIFCVGLFGGIVLYRKNAQLKRRLVDSLSVETANRIAGPETYGRWRRVSEATRNNQSKPSSSSSEFEYVSFSRPTPRPRMRTTPVQTQISTLELMKEKVVPLNLADVADGSGNPQHVFNYITKHEEYIDGYEGAPTVRSDAILHRDQLQLQMSEQTQTIVRAIRSELRKFEPRPERAELCLDCESDQSLPSGSSEA